MGSDRGAWGQTEFQVNLKLGLTRECRGDVEIGRSAIVKQRPYTQLRIRAFCPEIFAFLAVFRVVVVKERRTAGAGE